MRYLSALSVVVFQMLVGSVAADTKATKEMLTHSTTTDTVERRRINVTGTQQVRALNVALANGQGILAVLFPLW